MQCSRNPTNQTPFSLLAPTNTVDFHSPVTTTELNRFIDYSLQPTDEFNREMNKSVDEICSLLREHLSPCKTVKVYIPHYIDVQFFQCLVKNKKRVAQLLDVKRRRNFPYRNNMNSRNVNIPAFFYVYSVYTTCCVFTFIHPNVETLKRL